MLWPEFSCFSTLFQTFGKNPNNWNSFQFRRHCAWQLRGEEAWNHFPPILCRCSQIAENRNIVITLERKASIFSLSPAYHQGHFRLLFFSNYTLQAPFLIAEPSFTTSAVHTGFFLYISASVSFPSFYLTHTDQRVWWLAFLICLKLDMPWCSDAIEWHLFVNIKNLAVNTAICASITGMLSR